MAIEVIRLKPVIYRTTIRLRTIAYSTISGPLLFVIYFLWMLLLSASCTRSPYRSTVVQGNETDTLEVITKPAEAEAETDTASANDSEMEGDEDNDPFSGANPKCGISEWYFGFELDSCVCNGIDKNADTFFVGLPGGWDTDRPQIILRFTYPEDDKDLYVVQYHQNRMATSFMAADLVYEDWMKYTSPADTLKYNPAVNGFLPRNVPDSARELFPKYTEIQLLDAYILEMKKQFGDKKISRKEMENRFKQDWEFHDILVGLSSPELHRIFLLVRSKKDPNFRYTIVLEMPHFG